MNDPQFVALTEAETGNRICLRRDDPPIEILGINPPDKHGGQTTLCMSPDITDAVWTVRETPEQVAAMYGEVITPE